MFRWVVNAVLLSLPVGATVGILMGIDSHRTASGQEPLFNGGNGGEPGDDGSSGGGGGTTYPKDNGITESTYCQKELAISPPSKGVQYTLNPNQWGWETGDPGALCMNVTAFHNQTYTTKTSAPSFSVTWQYPPGPEDAPVHAFPHIQVDSLSVSPSKLSSVSSIDIDLAWSYSIGENTTKTTDVAALTKNLVNTNVAIDMFMDDDKTRAQNASKANFEVMVWFAAFGTATQPIGLTSGTIATKVVNGTTFELYHGLNGLNQTVLTWYAPTTTESFTGDIYPLLSALTSMTTTTTTTLTTEFPTTDTYLGYLGFGSEAFSSNVNVTFSAPTLAIDIQS